MVIDDLHKPGVLRIHSWESSIWQYVNNLGNDDDEKLQ